MMTPLFPGDQQVQRGTRHCGHQGKHSGVEEAFLQRNTCESSVFVEYPDLSWEKI